MEQPPAFKYLLGERVLDKDEGDAGCLQKKAQIFPVIHFIRSQYCGKSNEPGSKAMHVFHITTGIVVAYINTFEVLVYNI